MPSLLPIEQYTVNLQNQPKSFRPEQTGFVENAIERAKLVVSQELPITSRVIPSEAESMRIKQLYDYSEQYPELHDMMGHAWTPSRQFDLEKAAVYANKTLGLTDVPIAEDYRQRVNEEYAEERQHMQEIDERATVMGKIGSFVGAGVASMLDPIYAAGMLTGYGGASTALQAAIRVGLISAGLEVAAAPLIADFKSDIGTEYTAAEAFTNIMAAGVFGGVMAGGGKWLEIKAKAKADKLFSAGLDSHGISIEDSVYGWSSRLKALIEEKPQLKAHLKPVLHILDNYPDQAASAREVLMLDSNRTVWQNSVYRSQPDIEDIHLTPEQVFDNERTRAELRWREAGEQIQNKPHEWIYAWDKDKQQIGEAKTDFREDSVTMTAKQWIDGVEDLHNQPGQKAAVPSTQDVRMFFMTKRKEMRVITKEGNMFILRKAKGVEEIPEDVIKEITEAARKSVGYAFGEGEDWLQNIAANYKKNFEPFKKYIEIDDQPGYSVRISDDAEPQVHITETPVRQRTPESPDIETKGTADIPETPQIKEEAKLFQEYKEIEEMDLQLEEIKEVLAGVC